MQRATIYVCATCPSLNCRLEFNNLVQKHGSDRGAKGLTSWSQFIAMPFATFLLSNQKLDVSGQWLNKTIYLPKPLEALFL